jgi:hypothetical protein
MYAHGQTRGAGLGADLRFPGRRDLGRLRRGGLRRGLGSVLPLSLAQAPAPVTINAPACSASEIDQVLAGNYLLCQQQSGLNTDAVSQIQGVVDNASAAGYSPDVIAAMQSMADYQISQVGSDTAAITESVADSNYAQSPITGLFNLLTNPGAAPASLSWTWLYWLAGGGLALYLVTR